MTIREKAKEKKTQSINLRCKDELKGFTLYKPRPLEYQTHGGYV